MSSMASTPIPKNWSWKTVGEFTTEHKQGYYTKESYISIGTYLIRITDLGNPTIDYSEMPRLNIDEKEFQQFKVSVGDFLFARSGAIGRYGIVIKNHPAVFASYLIRFRFDDTLIFTRYFGYLYESDLCQKQLASITQGSSNININAENIKSLLIPFAPLTEQKKIASILTAVDDVIESTQAKIDKLKDLKTGMMQELLTKGIGHTEFKALPKWHTGKVAEIDEIPSTWKLVNILSVAKLESGHTPSRDTPEYWDGDVPWVSLHDTKQLGVRVIHETNLYITQEGLNNSSARLLPEGTVAFSRTASVGHCVIFGREMATSQDFANYVCGPELSNRYLLHLFKWMQHVWSNLSEGSTHQTIYMPIFKKLQILLPPLSEQITIAAAADKIDDSILVIEKKLAAHKNMKKALMQDLLTGKVRVKVN